MRLPRYCKRVFERSFLLAAGAAALLAMPAGAAPPSGPSHGAAMAVAAASLNGGPAAWSHDPGANGAPAQFEYAPDGPRILPFGNGLSYCAAGWHVISIGAAQSVERGTRDALAALRETSIEFTLDGVALAVRRTSPHRYIDPFGLPGDYFAVNGAALLPPGSLTPGEHGLVTVIRVPGAPPDVMAIRFLVTDC